MLKTPSLLEVYTGFHVAVGDVYISTTKRSANTRFKEHERNCRLRQAEKSALAEHSLLYPEHMILFEETTMLSNEKHYHPQLYLEAIEIFKQKRRGPQNQQNLVSCIREL